MLTSSSGFAEQSEALHCLPLCAQGFPICPVPPQGTAKAAYAFILGGLLI